MKKIKIGFVGLGWMGTVQLNRIAERSDVEVVAVFEKNKAKGREVLAKLGFSEDILVDDYQQIVDNPDIDAVWLVSPNSFHGPQSIAALEAGKHIFCEKPVATTFDDYLKQIKLSKSKPALKTFVDYILYFDDMEKRLVKMITDDDFGQIIQIQVNYRHPVNITGDKVWKLDKAIMGDAIGMGINHAISAIVFALASQAKPKSVYATSTNPKVRNFQADPVYNILIKFDNGATGFCFGNIDNGNGYELYHNVFGTKGGFIFDSQIDSPAYKVRYWSEKTTSGKWVQPLDIQKCKEAGMEDLAWSAGSRTPDSGDVMEHGTRQCVEHFIDCVKNDKSSPLSFVNSQIVAEIGWAAQMSAALGKEIPLPLNEAEAGEFFAAEK